MKIVSPPDTDAISTLFQRAAESAIQVLQETGEYLPTITLGSCPPGARELLAYSDIAPHSVRLMQADQEKKAVLRRVIQDTLDPSSPLHLQASAMLGAEINVVIHITESWVSRPTHKDGPHVPPSQDPQRTEALTVIIHTGRGTALGVCPITRDQDGCPSAVPGDLIGPDGELIGALVTNPLDRFSPPAQAN